MDAIFAEALKIKISASTMFWVKTRSDCFGFLIFRIRTVAELWSEAWPQFFFFFSFFLIHVLNSTDELWYLTEQFCFFFCQSTKGHGGRNMQTGGTLFCLSCVPAGPGAAPALPPGLRTWLYKAFGGKRSGLFLERAFSASATLFGLAPEEMDDHRHRADNLLCLHDTH